MQLIWSIGSKCRINQSNTCGLLDTLLLITAIAANSWAQSRILPIANVRQDALAARERELRSIVNTIPTTAWTTRPDGYCDFLNQRWLDYAGMTPEQAAGWGWTAAIHPDDRTGLSSYVATCLASGEPGEAEARMRRFDGAYRWFLFRANPLRDESGNIVKWYGTNIDIEDRKRGEEALRASELSWRQIVDNIPGLVATTGAMGEVEFLNRQTLEYFGKTSEELKNWALIGAVHPDDLPHVIEARKKSIETGQIYEVEHRCRRADGVYRWFQVRGLPVRNAEGTITAWYLLLTDIDDRKKAEEALQSSERNLSLIINAIPTFIHVSRPDGSVLSVNQTVLDYTRCQLWRMCRKRTFALGFPSGGCGKAARGAPGGAQTRRYRSNMSNVRWVRTADIAGSWSATILCSMSREESIGGMWPRSTSRTESGRRRRSSRAYLRLAEAQRLSKTGSFITDLVADEHNWSEEAFRIFEFDPATKVTVQRIRDMIHPEDLPSFDVCDRARHDGRRMSTFAFRIVTARGAVKHVRGMARVMEQVAGRPVFIGALQDVTESKLAEEALDQGPLRACPCGAGHDAECVDRLDRP